MGDEFDSHFGSFGVLVGGGRMGEEDEVGEISLTSSQPGVGGEGGVGRVSESPVEARVQIHYLASMKVEREEVCLCA